MGWRSAGLAITAAAVVVTLASSAAARQAADVDFTGTWTLTAAPGTPWASGGTLIIARGSASSVPAKTGQAAWDSYVKGYCTGPPPPGGTQPAVRAWYTLTGSWPGSGRMGGCVSDRTNGQLIFFGQGSFGHVQGRNGDQIFGDWTNNPKGGSRFAATLAGGGGAPAEPAVKISGLSRKVEVQQNETTWVPASDSLTLKAGDKIHTGFKAGATLTFPDGSTLVVKPMSLVLIQSVETAGGKTTVFVWLKLGEVSASINRSRGSAADFEVKTPTLTTSVRGTVFSVLYDGSASIVSVRKGTVSVKPNAGKAVDVTAGHEVSGTASSVSAPAAIGTAGAPAGSVGQSKAVALLTATLVKGLAACKADAYSVVLKPVKKGWRATVKIVGAKKGSATWTITGTKVAPTNGLAKTISRGCT